MKDSIVGTLPNYTDYINGHDTLGYGYPWITVSAILALEQHVLRREMRVLELGSGGSTVFLAERVAHVTSLESNPLWAHAVTDALHARQLSDRATVIATQEGKLPTNADCETAMQQAIHTCEDHAYDLLFVDHAVYAERRTKQNRLRATRVALSKLKPHGWLVVDNRTYHKMDQLDLRGWKVWHLDQMGWNGRGTLIATR
jgi:predicted O-methyltransferase YrrM